MCAHPGFTGCGSIHCFTCEYGGMGNLRTILDRSSLKLTINY